MSSTVLSRNPSPHDAFREQLSLSGYPQIKSVDLARLMAQKDYEIAEKRICPSAELPEYLVNQSILTLMEREMAARLARKMAKSSVFQGLGIDEKEIGTRIVDCWADDAEETAMLGLPEESPYDVHVRMIITGLPREVLTIDTLGCKEPIHDTGTEGVLAQITFDPATIPLSGAPGENEGSAGSDGASAANAGDKILALKDEVHTKLLEEPAELF